MVGEGLEATISKRWRRRWRWEGRSGDMVFSILSSLLPLSTFILHPPVFQFLGDRVLRPFLQDTIQLLPLGLTMTGMMLLNPGAIFRVLAQVRDREEDMGGEGLTMHMTGMRVLNPGAIFRVLTQVREGEGGGRDRGRGKGEGLTMMTGMMFLNPGAIFRVLTQVRGGGMKRGREKGGEGLLRMTGAMSRRPMHESQPWPIHQPMHSVIALYPES